MLLGDFFEIINMDNAEGGSLTARIRFNKDHRIFRGHFPGFPVVPGVCMIQLVKEILAYYHKTSLFLAIGDNIKFLRFINPNIDETVMVQVRSVPVNGDRMKTEATIFKDENKFLKFKGVFLKTS